MYKTAKNEKLFDCLQSRYLVNLRINEYECIQNTSRL